MGANPNTKGSGGEREVKNILLAHGYEAGCTGKWKKLDVWWKFRGVKRMLEVKRRKWAWSAIYKAFSEDAWFIGRADNEKWFIAMPLLEYLKQNSNTGHPIPLSQKAGGVIEVLTPLTTDTSQHG